MSHTYDYDEFPYALQSKSINELAEAIIQLENSPNLDGRIRIAYINAPANGREQRDPMPIYLDKVRGELRVVCEDASAHCEEKVLLHPITRDDVNQLAAEVHDIIYDKFEQVERSEREEDLAYENYNQRPAAWLEENFPFQEDDKLAVIIERQMPDGNWEILSKNGTSEDYELQGKLGESVFYSTMRAVGTENDTIFRDLLYTLAEQADNASAISKKVGQKIEFDIRVVAAEISPPDENGQQHVISIHTCRTNTNEIRETIKKEIYKAEHYNPLEDLTTSRTYPIKTKTTEGVYEGFKVNVGPAVFSLYSTVPSSEDSVLPMVKMEWNSKAIGLPDRVEGLYAQEIEKKALGVLSRSRQVPEEVRKWCSETLVLAEKTKRLLEEYESFEIPSELGDSYAITSKMTDDGKVYVCDSKAISAESANIYELTGRLASRNDHVEKYRREEQVLQNFFEHRIVSLYEAESLSREEAENYEAFEQMYEAHYKEPVPPDFHESKCYVKMEQHADEKNRHSDHEL